jgi:glutathione peroxidase|tara:strand:- start:1007 stop:1489 length:483 start_codon:yes stop_codon:yes gene_type:complete
MSNQSIYDFTVEDSSGNPVSLEDYRGKVVLIVNTASKCGFTPQYTQLQELYDQYSARDFVVLALPCNQFGGQEPGSNAEVQEFCQMNFGLSFPVMGKIDVNGKEQHALYTHLKSQAGGILNSKIKWNFTKFLVDREGQVVERYAPIRKPKDIAADIEKLL